MRVSYVYGSGSFAVRIERESADDWCVDKLQDIDRTTGFFWQVGIQRGSATDDFQVSASYNLASEHVTVGIPGPLGLLLRYIILWRVTPSRIESFYLTWPSSGYPELDPTAGGRTYIRAATLQPLHSDTLCDPVEASTDSSWSSLATLRRPSTRPTASISINRNTAYAGQSYTVVWTTSSNTTTVRVRYRASGIWVNHSTQASGATAYTVLSSWTLGIRTWEIRATNSAGSTTRTDTIDIIADPADATTDSSWSSLERMTTEAATDSSWSSLVRLAREANNPPVWNLPSAFNITVNNSTTFNLLNYCSDPDGDSLSFTASESSTYFSIRLSGSTLVVSGGNTDQRPAGNISFTASDGQASVSASVPVNVLDTSRNAAPVVATPRAPFPRAVLTGQGRNRVQVGDQYVATDADGDSIRTWEIATPNGWRQESAGYLTSSTTPDAQQTGYVQLSAIEDYFHRFSIMVDGDDPVDVTWNIPYRVRCRDSRRAWSNYVSANIEIVQAVHGSQHDLDGFQGRPDRRQPNIWAFKKGSTIGASAGGVHYQYATPDEARADKANWAGAITYAAHRLYVLRDGTTASRPHITGIRNVHGSLDAVLANDAVTFTPKADASPRDGDEYARGYVWAQLCQVFVVSGGDRTSPAYWASVSGFVFIDGGDPPTAALLTNGRNVSTYATTVGTRVTLSWTVTNAASLTLQLGASGSPVSFASGATFSPTFQASGVFTYILTVTGTNGDVVTDQVVITVIESSTDSPWSALNRMTPDPATDSAWSSLSRMTPEPNTDSDWSTLEKMLAEPSDDSDWSTLALMVPEASDDSDWSSLELMTPEPGTDSAWSSLEMMAPPEPSTDSDWSSLEMMASEPGTDSDWSSLEMMTPEPSDDSDWSSLEMMTPPPPGTDSEWSTLEMMAPPTTDGPWSPTISIPSLDGPWSGIIATPTTDGEWSEFIASDTQDGPWSDILGGLETIDGLWSGVATNDTIDGPWSDLVGVVTEDGPWSDLIGPLICDGLWSPFAFLEALTKDGLWSATLGSVTIDSEWSEIAGPLICDGLWSDFAFLEQATEDGPWSELLGVPTEDGPWSPLLETVADAEWSPVSNVAYAPRSGPPEPLVADGPWAGVSNAAYLVRPGPPEPVIHRSAWGPVSNAAYFVRSGPPTLLVANSLWSPVSNAAYVVRPGPLELLIANSLWANVSNPAYAPRAGPLELLWYILWSELSNTAYRPRAGPLVQMVHRSAWSPVSNVARQEREVLSAIGGAEPFLHIYEARRGLVQVRRLVAGTGSLVGTGFEEAVVNANRNDDRVLINPGITLADLQTGDVAIDVYRTTNSATNATAYRFYLANLEGVDPNIHRVYYDVTPNGLFAGTMPYRIRVTALSLPIGGSVHQSIILQRAFENGELDGTPISFSFSGASVPASAELVVVAVTPQHASARLSRIVYLNRQVNNWYYYHGVPEIYVSEPVDIVADEDAFSYNGRDSANFQSPPHVGYASALVRQHQTADNPWFEQLLNRNHVITGQRVHMMLRDSDGNYGKDFTGILQSPPLQHQDNIYDWRVTIQDPTALMVQSFSNSATLMGPQDAVATRTVGALIQRVAQSYANRVSGLTLDDVLDPNFAPANFPVPLAWFWTDYESERDILQRLVNTQGPPTGFHVNNLGQMVFTGCEDRGSPIIIGGTNGIPISQAVSFSDHVVDVANDARIPVSLHGWVLPDIATTPAQIYEEPTGLPEAVQVQLFETYSDNAIFDLARGGGITFDVNGEYRYRVRTAAPVLPTEAPTLNNPGFRITGVGAGVEVEQVAANLLEIVVKGAAGADVPEFQLLGAELKHFRTIENWTSQTVREENQTRFSRYLYHQREFSYGGYNSIAVRDAQLLADWVVRYYRKGIKTITLQLFCSNHVQEALRLEPDRTPVRIAHSYGAGAPEQWIVRSRKRVYRDGHFWVDVVLDEDVMYSLGLLHSPLCALYAAPDPATSATYAVNNSGELTYTGTSGAALAIPQQGFLSAAPDLAATVLPIAATSDTPQTVLTRAGGVNLFQLVAGTYKAAHFDLTRLEALNDSAFYADGLRANGLSLWLVEPKTPSDSYWAVANFNFRADGFDGDLPAAFHFLRVRYAALGAHSDVVLSFVAPNMTIHDTANHWITVAQEQPWLGADAAAALRLHQHVIILDWQAFPMDAPIGSAGLLESPSYVNDAVVAADASPSTNVGGANGAQIVRRFGRS